jgi:hypothetical protein
VNVAQHLVVGTSHWPILRNLYVGAYDLGLAFVARRFTSLPGIQAVMIREAKDRRWQPGWSDYDLTMILERGDVPLTLRRLDDVWRRYRQLKRQIPPLGELEIMHAGDYRDFLAFGPMETGSIKRARPIVVKSTPDVEEVLHAAPRAPLDREFLVDALARYARFFFPAWLSAIGGSTAFAGKRATHLLENVRARLRAVTGLDPPEHVGANLDARATDLFHALTMICARWDLHDLEGGVDVRHRADGSAASLPAIASTCSAVIRLANVERCAVIAWTPYMSTRRIDIAFVVPDDTPPESIARLVTSLAAARAALDRTLATAALEESDLQSYQPALRHPVVMSASMWRCWLVLSPFLGAAVAASGRVVAGSELCDAPRPSKAAFRRGAEVFLASLLPLKNNWRPLRGPLTPRIYAALADQARGCFSAISGDVVTSPAPCVISSDAEGYRAVVHAQAALRDALRA